MGCWICDDIIMEDLEAGLAKMLLRARVLVKARAVSADVNTFVETNPMAKITAALIIVFVGRRSRGSGDSGSAKIKQ